MNMREENSPRGGGVQNVTGQMWQVKEHASDVKTGHHWWSECSPPEKLPSTVGGEEKQGAEVDTVWGSLVVKRQGEN